MPEVVRGASKHVGEVADHRGGDAFLGDRLGECVAHVRVLDVLEAADDDARRVVARLSDCSDSGKQRTGGEQQAECHAAQCAPRAPGDAGAGPGRLRRGGAYCVLHHMPPGAFFATGRPCPHSGAFRA